MSPNVIVNFDDRNSIEPTGLEVNRIPDSCPLCHRGIQPIQRFGWCKFREHRLWVIFECPLHECGCIFFSYYTKIGRPGIREEIYKLVFNAPWQVKKEAFPEEVVQISKKFSEIYNQAKEAEERKLKEICGAGYRKALEFLIKDYLKKENVAEPEIIEKTRLYDCIKKHVESDRIKDCAKRAAWLNNDETHYIKKWKDKDLSDLKKLIRLTVNWIHDDHLTREIKKDMPEKKAKK